MRFLFSAGFIVFSLTKHASSFLLMNSLVAYERFDPIVQPGIVSGNLHAVIGASAFRETFSPAVWSSSNCSTMQIQENKSNYWMPSITAPNDNGTFSALPLVEVRTYYMNHVRFNRSSRENPPKDVNNSTSFSIRPARSSLPSPKDFACSPVTLSMLAGDPSRTSPVANDPGFIGYTCHNGNFNVDGLEKHLTYIPDYTCKQFMRAELQFPDCWNGIDLDSTDHKSHMSYQVSGTCLSTHPVAVAQISLEFGWRTYDYRPDQLQLSTGDQAGYGLHADYLSFWDVDLLQATLDDTTCQQRENIFGDGAQCQTLVTHRNEVTMQSCVLESNIPREQVRISVPIPSLPGCNGLWNSSASQTKAACSPAPQIPAIGKASGLYNFNSRSDPAFSPRVDIPGYWGFNPQPVTSMQSSTTTMVKSTTSVTSTKATTLATKQWNSLGCYTDSTTSRVLPISGAVSAKMTFQVCEDKCKALGYSFAGVEYSTECWCGSSIGGGQIKANGRDCDMACSGSSNQKCGGGNRINIYQYSQTAVISALITRRTTLEWI